MALIIIRPTLSKILNEKHTDQAKNGANMQQVALICANIGLLLEAGRIIIDFHSVHTVIWPH
jgi:hypothetical protein